MKRIAAALCAASLLIAQPAYAQQDPALQQQVSETESIAAAGEKVVIDHGHIDIGAIEVDGDFDLLARDDSEAHPVWRHLDDMVFKVSDAALQTLPEDSTFEFTGAKAGDKVYVVPQSQISGVPWIGWNSQAPSIQKVTDRGVTLELAGYQGPGHFSLFLQAGGVQKPQVIWDADEKGAQPMWVELNTHTHANWVFTEPGVHQVAVRLKLPRTDGTEVETTRVLRFAVGDASVAEAQKATFDGEMTASESGEEQAKGSANIGLIAGGVVAVIVVIAGAAVFMSRQSARRRAEAKNVANG